MSEKKETYLVTLTILEGRHFAWPSMNSAVFIEVGRKRKHTTVQKATDCPFFNQYFVFELKTTLQKLLDTSIKLTVIRPCSCFRERKTLGSVVLDVATVWNQSEHQFYHKWAILSSDKIDMPGPRGYLKVDINILAAGQSPNIPSGDEFTNDDIEGNLLLPLGVATERQQAMYIFNVYRGENFTKSTSRKDSPTVQIIISFAGKTVKTVAKNKTQNPIWNEQLKIKELFPPLCQRVKIIAKLGEQESLVYYLNLHRISNDGENGFIPTFGPDLIYFYHESEKRHGYAGKITFSMTTIVQDGVVELDNSPAIPRIDDPIGLWKDEPFMVFCIIFEASFIDRVYRHKSLSFEVSIGPFSGVRDEKQSEKSAGEHVKPFAATRAHYYLKLLDNKPCIQLKFDWPDYRKRSYKYNMINAISTELEVKFAEIKELFESEEYSLATEEIQEKLSNAVDYIATSCRKCIDMLLAYENSFPTTLDKERHRLYITEMQSIEEKCSTVYDPMAKRKTFNKIRRLHERLVQLKDDTQKTMPDIFIAMLSGSKQIGAHRIIPSEVMYSIIEEERGELCGKLHSILLEPLHVKPKLRLPCTRPSNVCCKLDLLLWMGLEKHLDACLASIPEGFSPQDFQTTGLPTRVVAQETHLFQCRAHIYHGRFIPGMDTSGLSDTFVNIIIGPYEQHTKVQYASINPVWDETLIFKCIEVYGSKEFIRQNPPTVVLECLDKDKCGFLDLLGRNKIVPLLKFTDEPYSPPNFPPVLNWVKSFDKQELIGEVLCAVEMLEISDYPSGKSDTDSSFPLIRIPSDIKPLICNYRIAVVFWGLRDLKKSHCTSMLRMKVSLTCGGVVLDSDTLENTNKNLNFKNHCKYADVNFPCQKNYAPSVPIKMFDCRSFGRYVYTGIHLFRAENFMYMSYTESNRERRIQEVIIQSLEFSMSDLVNTIRLPSKDDSLPTDTLEEDTTKDTKTKAKATMKKCLKSLCCLCGICSKNNKDYALVPSSDSEKSKSTKDVSSKQSNSDKMKKCCCFFCSICVLCKAKEKKNEIKSNEKSKKKKGRLRHICLLSRIVCCLLDCIIFLLTCIYKCCTCCPKKKRTRHGIKDSPSIISMEVDKEYDMQQLDWWTKYYTSTGGNDSINALIDKFPHINFHIKIYSNELENQPEFEEFKDILMPFPMYKGKRTGDDLLDAENIMGIFKGAIKIYRWPPNEHIPYINDEGEVPIPYVTHTGFPLEKGVFQDFRSNEMCPFSVRIYIVKGFNLRPKDLNGKSDPYVRINMGDQLINDRKNYVPKTVNPIFGRYFELHGMFPMQHKLKISVWDVDKSSRDDLIGETTIDIENRFYTNHRAHCGLARSYQKEFFSVWRDKETPSDILELLCRKNNVPSPQYFEYTVNVFYREFTIPPNSSLDESLLKDTLALHVLHSFHEIPLIGCHLVPEHVETRSLYHPDKPELEQGKLQLWLDIFPIGDAPLPRPVDITPRKPVTYELRVIIWNTEDVLLKEDDFFTGDKKSDIYVKSWLGTTDTVQRTDVHYRSLNGEGNFNWRFVFRFDYLITENRIVYKKKDSVFSVDETEHKLPCKITFQIWDNDTITLDDFIGATTFELRSFVRGAKEVTKCTLAMIGPDARTINLFKNRRTKGWWPCMGKDENTDEQIIAGKLEAEFELLTLEEAESNPVGLGRENPQALPKPNRPDTSFTWFKNPLKALKYTICKVLSFKTCLKLILLVLCGAFIGLAIYAFPGYSVKRLLGA